MTWITSTAGACVVAAFILGAILGSGFSRQREDAERDQSHADKLDYPSDTDEKTSIAALARAHVAFAKDANSTDERQSSYNKRSHRISFWTAIGIVAYTVFTAVIVVFNIVQYGESHRFNKKQIRFLNGQLAEMRSSSLQTGQTIAAVQDQAHSLTGQLNAFANSQRAFVSLVNVQATPTVLNNGQVAWIMQSVWINSGNTQTKRLTIAEGCGYEPQEIADPYNKISWEGNKNPALLGPKVAKVMIGCPVFVDDDTIAQVSRGSRFFYTVGQACYEDILRPGVPHLTEYSDRIINMRRDGNNLVFTAANFGAHNCADEDCPDYNTACRTIGTDKRK